MDGFTDANGRVQVYRSDDPTRPHPMRPAATGYENFYYSQPLPDGGQENHRFEDLWNSIETVWPETVRALQARRLSPAISLNVQGMKSIMRVRVPAARDRTAIMLEAKLRSECMALDELGKLPPGYERYAGKFDTVPIGINPHHTLIAMNRHFIEMGGLDFRLGFEALHNSTGTPFITSDNPVCYYDPSHAVDVRVPYETAGEVELIFPLTASMLLRGRTSCHPVNTISKHTDITDRSSVVHAVETLA